MPAGEELRAENVKKRGNETRPQVAGRGFPGFRIGAQYPADRWQASNEAGGECAADGREGAIEAAGDGLHASGGSKCDQSNSQGVLDQVLAFFAMNEVLNLETKNEKHSVYFSPLFLVEQFLNGQK